MTTLEYRIAPEYAGWTVERYLRRVQGVSGRIVKSLKHREDGLLKNGAHVRSVDPLAPGDLLTLNLPEETKRLPPCTTPVPVLYLDDDVLVYDKPSGMPVHQSGGHIFGTLASVYATQFGGGDNLFRPVNRIDMDTTGALVVARHRVAACKLWKAVEKRYVAIAAGVPEPARRLVDLPLTRETPMEMKRCVDPDGQRAVTEYRVLASAPDRSCALCGFVLHTGRTHQIRVHMAYLGHPLLGDALYGGDTSAMPRQALHCAAVRFPAVMTGRTVAVRAPLPADMADCLKARNVDYAPALEAFLSEFLSGADAPAPEA